MEDDTLPPPHPDPHRQAWDAIPWVAAGVASPEDTERVLLHLPQCAECSAEWALHQRVGRALQAGVLPPAAHTEAGWQRMAARLTDDASAAMDATAPTTIPAPAPGLASPRTPGAGPWTRWLVAAVVVQALGLGAAGLALRDRALAADRAGEFLTLSEASHSPLAVSVRLVPAPQMSFGTLQPLLASTGMLVVEVAADGTSLGLAAADGQAGTVRAALTRLRATPGVLLAEPVAHLPR